MNLLLIRHAEAVDKGVDGVSSDFDRHLTERGRTQAVGLAAALRSRGVPIGAVISSPLIRAVQTAEPLLELSAYKELVLCDYLAPEEFRPKKLSRFIEEQGAECVALVGHMPDISSYAGWLLGTDEAAIPFAKGGAALIVQPDEIKAGAGTLEWFLPPEWYLGTN